jgi:aspartokinase
MSTPTTNHEHEHFPCDCHRPEHAYTDSLCPMCEDAKREMEREEQVAAFNRQYEAQDDAERKANNDAFIDAASQMSREDWDADNDWLASAGWGEM